VTPSAATRAAALAAVAPVLFAFGPGTSVHQQALERYAVAEPFGPESVVPPTAEQKASRERCDGGPVVMGYLPYWVEPENIPWETIDIIAWFGVPTNADGSLGNDHGWGEAGADAVVAAAHEVGAAVVLSTTRFGGDEVHELLSNPTASAAAIGNLVDAMLAGGGDGIDVDYEGLLAADREAMVAFTADLRAALDDAQPGSLLTMATPAVDWSGAWDYDVLATYADVMFIMGYGFHGTWSGPGPIAPLDGGDPWGSRSLRWSVQDYLEWGGVENADTFVMGLPLYGYQWEASGPEVPADDSWDAWSMFWTSAHEVADEHGSSWEPVSATRWAAWEESSGDWRQLWYEDAESIRLKAEMTRDEGIGGFGFFSLNYDQGDAELWAAVADVVEGWDGGVPDDDDDSAPPDDDDSAPADDDDSAVVTDDDDDTTDDDDLFAAPGDQSLHRLTEDGSSCSSSGQSSPGLLLLLPLLAWRLRR
jgi:hypothetical protein